MNARIYTYTGKQIDLFDVRDEDIEIQDIAHGLACVNRFAGQARHPISVAQHSLYVAKLCSAKNQVQALLHDASEAYLGDVTKWLKGTPAMKAYREIEDRLQRQIFRRFGCAEWLSPEVERADRVMARFEGERSFEGFVIEHPDYPPLTSEQVAEIGAWSPWTWQTAEEMWLRWVRLLQ